MTEAGREKELFGLMPDEHMQAFGGVFGNQEAFVAGEFHKAVTLLALLSHVEVDWKRARDLAMQSHERDLIHWLIEAIESGENDAVVYAELALKHQARLGYLHEPDVLQLLIGIYRDRYGWR